MFAVCHPFYKCMTIEISFVPKCHKFAQINLPAKYIIQTTYIYILLKDHEVHDRRETEFMWTGENTLQKLRHSITPTSRAFA